MTLYKDTVTEAEKGKEEAKTRTRKVHGKSRKRNST